LNDDSAEIAALHGFHHVGDIGTGRVDVRLVPQTGVGLALDDGQGERVVAGVGHRDAATGAVVPG